MHKKVKTLKKNTINMINYVIKSYKKHIKYKGTIMEGRDKYKKINLNSMN